MSKHIFGKKLKLKKLFLTLKTLFPNAIPNWHLHKRREKNIYIFLDAIRLVNYKGKNYKKNYINTGKLVT
jgi:uncharacterized RmlC-like cupin family protein